MTEPQLPVQIAVPRKGRPLEAVLDRLASVADAAHVADDVISTLRFEKSITKDDQRAERDIYSRLSEYSDITDPYSPDFTLLRDDRDGKPRRIVFDSLTIDVDGTPVQLVGREEPFRALRTHEFALGFDSADLVLEEVVTLDAAPLTEITDLNDRIDPHDTDVRVVSGLGDTVYHTLMATPETLRNGPRAVLDRAFIDEYAGALCISPRYERLVEAVLGTGAASGLTFTYPDPGLEEEAAIADTGIGIYLTVSGNTARDHGLELGDRLFPSETVLLENISESAPAPIEAVKRALATPASETAIAPPN